MKKPTRRRRVTVVMLNDYPFTVVLDRRCLPAALREAKSEAAVRMGVSDRIHVSVHEKPAWLYEPKPKKRRKRTTAVESTCL